MEDESVVRGKRKREDVEAPSCTEDLQLQKRLKVETKENVVTIPPEVDTWLEALASPNKARESLRGLYGLIGDVDKCLYSSLDLV